MDWAPKNSLVYSTNYYFISYIIHTYIQKFIKLHRQKSMYISLFISEGLGHQFRQLSLLNMGSIIESQISRQNLLNCRAHGHQYTLAFQNTSVSLQLLLTATSHLTNASLPSLPDTSERNLSQKGWRK
jgi:hypothetical protein